MDKNTSSNKRIAVNTVFLYVRSIIIMLVNIYTSRVVLQALGVDDYGIVNVVGGFVGMFAILSSSLVHASQRFISYEMGKEHPELNKVFCGTVSIHILLAFILLLLFETFGVWFLNSHLNLASDRLYAANWVFQFSVGTFCINILNTPFNACIIAHEKMSTFAYISVFEAFAKLGIVYLLFISSIDKLILYSFLLFLIAGTLWLIYYFYCRRTFEECKFRFTYDKKLFKDLLSFSGWNFLGSTAGILLTQGINILVNIFFGVALNAARGIAEQVNNAVNQFVSNFMTALNPQITQSHAAKDYDRMNILMLRGAKYSTLLFWLFGNIVFIETDTILGIWLTEVPPYASVFLKLIIIYSIFQSLSNSLYIGMLATGKIKQYQIIMSSLYISCFVLCFLFFHLGLGAEYGYYSAIIAVALGMVLRLVLLENMIPSFSRKAYVKDVLLRTMPVIIGTSLICLFVKHALSISEVIMLFVIILVSTITLILLSFCFAFDKIEKDAIKSIVKKWKKKLV